MFVKTKHKIYLCTKNSSVWANVYKLLSKLMEQKMEKHEASLKQKLSALIPGYENRPGGGGGGGRIEEQKENKFCLVCITGLSGKVGRRTRKKGISAATYTGKIFSNGFENKVALLRRFQSENKFY